MGSNLRNVEDFELPAAVLNFKIQGPFHSPFHPLFVVAVVVVVVVFDTESGVQEYLARS